MTTADMQPGNGSSSVSLSGRPAAGPRGNWKANGRLMAGMAFLILAAYLPSLRGTFLMDDVSVVQRNPRLTDDGGLRRIWFSTESEQYQPLVYTTYWIEKRLWGNNPIGYRVVNVLLHIVNALLLFAVFRRAGVLGAAVAAMLFALHPLNVESVAWIYERKNVLSGLFFLLTFVLLLRHHQLKRPACYCLAIPLFALALLSKASTVVLPAILLLYWWSARALNARKLLESLPFFVMAGAMAALTVWYEKELTGAAGPAYDVGFGERFARAGWIVAFFAGKIFAPVNLCFLYPQWSIDASAVTSYAPHAVILIVLAVLVVKHKTWGRPTLLGVGIFLIALFPVMGFFDIYYHQHALVADHFAYLPLIGLVGLTVHVAAVVLRRAGFFQPDPSAGRSKAGVRELAFLFIALCWYLTWQRTQVFANPLALCNDTIEKNPASWVAYQKRAEFTIETLTPYLAWYRSELKVPAAQADEQVAGERVKRLEQALADFRKALELQTGGQRGVVLANIGSTLQQLDRGDEAMTYFRQAVDIDPDKAALRLLLGDALERSDQVEAAVAEYQIAVELDPKFLMARRRLGQLLLRAGRPDDAIPHLAEAARMSPKDTQIAALLEAARQQVEARDRQPAPTGP